TAMNEFMPNILARYLSAHADVNVELRERLSHQVVKAVLEGVADIGITAAPAADLCAGTGTLACVRPAACAAPAGRRRRSGRCPWPSGPFIPTFRHRRTFMNSETLREVVLASGNAGKLREFSAILQQAGIRMVAQNELGVS